MAQPTGVGLLDQRAAEEQVVVEHAQLVTLAPSPVLVQILAQQVAALGLPESFHRSHIGLIGNGFVATLV